MRKLDGSVDASHQLVSDGRDGFLGVGLGVVSSAGERGTACGSQTSRTGFIWAAEATSLVAVAGVKARWAEASAERAVPPCAPEEGRVCGVPRAGGSGERRAVGTPTRGCADAACHPTHATDAVGAARSNALVGRAVRVAQAVLCRPVDARVAQEGSKYAADTRPSRTPGTRANGPAVLCMAGAKEGELRRATGQGRGRCDAARSNRRRG